jgi:hypothetical protein
MGLFDWLLNPAYAAINKAPPQRRQRLCQLVTAAGYLEFAPRELFVSRCEKLITAFGRATKESHAEAMHSLTRLRRQEQELSRDVVLALLKCCDRSDYIPTIMNGLSSESYAWCLSLICFARYQDSLKTVDDIEYSSVPAEARGQLISTWGRRLEIRSTGFAQALSDHVFATDWDTLVETLLDSTALAASRLDAATLTDRTKLITKGLRASGRAAIAFLVEARWESPECESDVAMVRSVFDEQLARRPGPPAKTSAAPGPSGPKPLGFADAKGTLLLDSERTSGRVQIVGQDETVEIAYSMLMMLWMLVDQEGWSGPCLWVGEANGSRTFVGFEGVGAVSSRDARDFVRALATAQRKQGKDISQTTAAFPEAGRFLRLCSKGGFRVVA